MSYLQKQVVLGRVPAHRRGWVERRVLWGWKRDKAYLSRTVYLRGRIIRVGSFGVFRLAHFFYKHRAKATDIDYIARQLTNIERSRSGPTFELDAKVDKHLGTLTLQIGQPEPEDRYLVGRLLKRRPHFVETTKLVSEAEAFDLRKQGPFDLMAGSGLSYEAGIPVLAQVHQAFGVDDWRKGDFTFGKGDLVPLALSQDPVGLFRRMVDVDWACIIARPAKSHLVLADLYRSGWIRQVFTDNVDDVFEQLGVPVTQTRKHGLFNEPAEIKFSEEAKSLLVIGVSADRRSVIGRGRKLGMKIVVINPALPVSPHSRNLDYLREGDLYYHLPAADALPRIGTFLRNPIRAVS